MAFPLCPSPLLISVQRWWQPKELMWMWCLDRWGRGADLRGGKSNSRLGAGMEGGHDHTGPSRQKGPAFGWPLCCRHLKTLNNFKVGSLHFYFAPDLPSYVTAPITENWRKRSRDLLFLLGAFLYPVPGWELSLKGWLNRYWQAVGN